MKTSLYSHKESNIRVIDCSSITILWGNQVKKIDRNILEDNLLKYAQDFFNERYENPDSPKIEVEFLDNYLNAFEWLSFNMYRTAGIELYADGEIRLNLMLEYTDYTKKCVFLTEAPILDRGLDLDLYNKLLELMMFHYQRKRVN